MIFEEGSFTFSSLMFFCLACGYVINKFRIVRKDFKLCVIWLANFFSSSSKVALPIADVFIIHALLFKVFSSECLSLFSLVRLPSHYFPVFSLSRMNSVVLLDFSILDLSTFF